MLINSQCGCSNLCSALEVQRLSQCMQLISGKCISNAGVSGGGLVSWFFPYCLYSQSNLSSFTSMIACLSLWFFWGTRNSLGSSPGRVPKLLKNSCPVCCPCRKWWDVTSWCSSWWSDKFKKHLLVPLAKASWLCGHIGLICVLPIFHQDCGSVLVQN